MKKSTFGKLLFAGAVGCGLLLNLGLSVRAIASMSQPAPVEPTQTDAELLAEVVTYLDRPEVRASQAARQKRLRDIELKLAAAHQQEAKEQRYADAQTDAVVLDNQAGTPVHAFGRQADSVTVACKSTEFGQVAVLSTSAAPEAFFEAKYLDACTPGQYQPGEEIGRTVAELSWSQHNQVNGGAVEPEKAYLEWALTGYSGEHAAPVAASADVDVRAIVSDKPRAIASNIKTFFKTPD